MSTRAAVVIGGLGSVVAVGGAIAAGRVLDVASCDGPMPVHDSVEWHEHDAAKGFMRGVGRLADLVATAATAQALVLVWQWNRLARARSTSGSIAAT